MPKITVSKRTMNILLKNQFLHKAKGNISVNREEMLEAMLMYADNLMSTRCEWRLPEKGIICFGPDNQVTHEGTMQWPEPGVSTSLLKGEGPRLLVVYGEAGSGVTTYIESMIASGGVDAEVHDHEPGGDAVNIVGALLAFEKGGKAIAAVGAESYQKVLEKLAYYADPVWINSPRGREVMRQCGAGML